jgi:hypothetical protein
MVGKDVNGKKNCAKDSSLSEHFGEVNLQRYSKEKQLPHRKAAWYILFQPPKASS